MLLDGASGEVTITTATLPSSGLPTAALGKTLVLTPNIRNAGLAAGVIGAIDWGCASTGASTAASKGIAIVTLGTLPQKYVPAECR